MAKMLMAVMALVVGLMFSSVTFVQANEPAAPATPATPAAPTVGEEKKASGEMKGETKAEKKQTKKKAKKAK